MVINIITTTTTTTKAPKNPVTMIEKNVVASKHIV